jgi:hypothetical protein
MTEADLNTKLTAALGLNAIVEQQLALLDDLMNDTTTGAKALADLIAQTGTALETTLQDIKTRVLEAS